MNSNGATRPGLRPSIQKVLFGDPTKPGFYMVMNRFQPGNFSKPHFHPNDRFITVVKGTWYVGTGNKWDKDATIGVKAGGAVTHFGKEVHYDGAKDEEVSSSSPARDRRRTRRSKWPNKLAPRRGQRSSRKDQAGIRTQPAGGFLPGWMAPHFLQVRAFSSAKNAS